MKFTEEKKKSIRSYILQKINSGCTNLTKTVSESLDINQNTVHTYVNSLVEENIIRRVKRGQYELISTKYAYDLKRSAGDLKDDIYALDKYLMPIISQYSNNVLDIWQYAFSEMINNVMDHSGAENVKLIILQNHIETTVFIQDDGIGIFKKIKEHFNFSSLDEAICELFKGKLTTDSKNHSGEGIFFSSRLMDSFVIVSDGKIFTNNKYDDSETATIPKEMFPGTLVIMSLSNSSQKQSKEVFDSFANDDGNFIKTKIPLKNIFESSPVSRSQARRICNRLENFQIVELDFEGIEWMGQGFAHQTFVVFHKEHPEIQIVPTNMNEDIQRMYNHVIASRGE